MSESLAAARPAVGAAQGAAAHGAAAADPRRALQLALAGLWLFDGILQYQPWMFTRAFPQMLGDSAQGNPSVVAGPITWSAGLIDHHLALLNAVFATIQVALGLGIAWRPTLRIALAASVAWSLAVWWLGEGLGGVLAGTASLIDGAPGAVILYAVLAVQLWPADRYAARNDTAPYVAARVAGPGLARALWLAVWGSMAVLAVLPAARAPHALSDAIAEMAPGEPKWLAWLDTRLASALDPHGLAASIVLAAVFAVIATGVFLPVGRLRPVLVLALLAAAALWLAQGLGAVFTGMSTDPNSGPLLALLALSFWPRGGRKAPRDGQGGLT
jgi:hypothetical protein